MRIAYLVSRFPQLSETFVLRELDELDRLGVDVVLCPLLRQREPVSHPAAARWVERAWYTPFVSRAIVRDVAWQVRRAPARSLQTVGLALAGVARSRDFVARTLAIWPKAFHLARRLEEAKVDHVHAHFATHPTTVAWMVGRLTGIPYSFTAHAHDLYVETAMLRQKLADARFVVTISDYNRRLLGRFGDASKVHVVRCGVELERYPLQRQPPPGPFTILTVASLQEYKGIEFLIRACAVLRDRGAAFRCLVVGGGVLRKGLERLAEELGVSDAIEFCGPRPQEEVAALLQRAHVFVLPSVVARDGQMEGLPVALMEALAAGVPVVASDLSGIPELVKPGETGALAAPGDPVAIADAVAEVIADPETARRRARAGRELVERRFVLADNVRELARLFERHVG